MNLQIENLKKTRVFVLDAIKDLSIEQWNRIPHGFNNNIAWNVAHLCSTMQGICYIRSGITPFFDEKFILLYKSGTKPERPLSFEEIEELKVLFLSAVDQLEADYSKNMFSNYTTWTNRYKVELTNIDEAIDFMLYHEGLHFGYIMALKRIVTT